MRQESFKHFVLLAIFTFPWAKKLQCKIIYCALTFCLIYLFNCSTILEDLQPEYEKRLDYLPLFSH